MSETLVNIVWVFHPDISKQGQQESVPVEEAKQWVRFGRARYTTDAQERKANAPHRPEPATAEK